MQLPGCIAPTPSQHWHHPRSAACPQDTSTTCAPHHMQLPGSALHPAAASAPSPAHCLGKLAQSLCTCQDAPLHVPHHHPPPAVGVRTQWLCNSRDAPLHEVRTYAIIPAHTSTGSQTDAHARHQRQAASTLHHPNSNPDPSQCHRLSPAPASALTSMLLPAPSASTGTSNPRQTQAHAAPLPVAPARAPEQGARGASANRKHQHPHPHPSQRCQH